MNDRNDIVSPDWHDITLDAPKTRCINKKKYERVRNKNKVRNEGRLVNSREYALAWGVINEPYSVRDLRAKCKAHDAPSASYILKEWGGYPFYYRELVRRGMKPRPPKHRNEIRNAVHPTTGKILKRVLLTEDFNLARYVAELGITKAKDYSELRNREPARKQFMPDVTTIRKRFGSWRLFKNEVMKYNVDMIVDNYVRESVKAGHWLKISECDKLKIPLREAMNVLRPRFFNALCYRKKELLDSGNILPEANKVKKDEE